MKRIIILLLPLLLLSCTKESLSSVQGEWCVVSIQEQTVTSTQESGWGSVKAALQLFVVNEVVTIGKSTITPCPSADASLKIYDNYKGYVNCSLSGSKLKIPEQIYTHAVVSGNEATINQASVLSITLDVSFSDDGMTLSGTHADTDLLGNVTKHINYRISLTRN